ncbi:MAG: DedA family protein [Candidatus Aenigmarchaeota archaeon]|nr:DedA family protein [Candidatus Aenigmarchaeota archaeon]
MPANSTLMASVASYVISLNSIFNELAGWGYIGIFLISLIGAATIILPLPSLFFVFIMGAELNPILVALLASVGAAIGEFTGYALGFGGSSLSEKNKKWKKEIEKTEKLFQKYGGFWVIVFVGATPLPDDVAGIVAGLLKYPPKKFLLATFIGKMILHLIVALAGFYSMGWVVNAIGGLG